MRKEQNKQINFIDQHKDLLKPHQLIRFTRWSGHFRKTGEYLQANFDRLESSIKKAQARLQPKPEPKIIPQAPVKPQPIIIYKKRRLIGGLKQDPSVEVVTDAK